MVQPDRQGVPTETLQAAWQKVKDNAGAAGVDGQSVERFGARAEMYLRNELSRWRGEATDRMPVQAGRDFEGGRQAAPAGNPGGQRPHRADGAEAGARTDLRAEFRQDELRISPWPGCKDALEKWRGWLKEGYTYVVDADLKSYFDTIPHDRLMERVKERVSDGRVLELIEVFLQQDIINDMETMDARRGDTARSGDQPAAGQHLSSSPGLSDGAEGLPDGALCGRLRDPVPQLPSKPKRRWPRSRPG